MRSNLDGMTLLRYAHIWRDRMCGGTEQYLNQLNNSLLAAHKITILQMHLVAASSSCSSPKVEVEKRGLGQLVWIPVPFHFDNRSPWSLSRRLKILAAAGVSEILPESRAVLPTAKRLVSNLVRHLRYSHMILSGNLSNVLDTYHVDLVVLHWLSYDVKAFLSHASRRRIPYAIIHHFDNHSLMRSPARGWLAGAAAIGGVSDRNVPIELQSKYVNLSDAVDTEFFFPHQTAAAKHRADFLVLLPSRIAEGKGHADLLLAVHHLERMGVKVSVAFAGCVESEDLLAELKRSAVSLGISDRTFCLGELVPEKLRSWYAACDVVVLPSSSEGLGRVLLEAQAMEKPVIAYESGGMPDALVSGKTGFLVQAGDHVALGDRLKYLVENSEQRVAMGELGRSFVKSNFSLDALVARHEQFYSQALSSRQVTDGWPVSP